jgi:hypothetical protein
MNERSRPGKNHLISLLRRFTSFFAVFAACICGFSCQQIFTYPIAIGLSTTTTKLPANMTSSAAIGLAEQAKAAGDTELASALLVKLNALAKSTSLGAAQIIAVKTAAIDMAVVSSNITQAVADAFQVANGILSSTGGTDLGALSTGDMQKIMNAFDQVKVSQAAVTAILALPDVAASQSVTGEEYVIDGVLLAFGAASKLGVTNLTEVAADPAGNAATLALIQADANFQSAVAFFSQGVTLMQAEGQTSPVLDPLSQFINRLNQ